MAKSLFLTEEQKSEIKGLLANVTEEEKKELFKILKKEETAQKKVIKEYIGKEGKGAVAHMERILTKSKKKVSQVQESKERKDEQKQIEKLISEL